MTWKFIVSTCTQKDDDLDKIVVNDIHINISQELIVAYTTVDISA